MSGYSKADIEKMLKQVRYDLSVTQTRVSDITAAVASLSIPEAPGQFACNECAGLSFPSERRLAEHRENVHGAPSDSVTILSVDE